MNPDHFTAVNYEALHLLCLPVEAGPSSLNYKNNLLGFAAPRKAL